MAQYTIHLLSQQVYSREEGYALSRTENTHLDVRTGRIDLVNNSHGTKPWYKKLRTQRERKVRRDANSKTRIIARDLGRLNEIEDDTAMEPHHLEVETPTRMRMHRQTEDKILI